jgi:hypothetical protein
MAGDYYVQATTKLLLDIAAADTSDDTLLDALGALAGQHIDNILKKHDEKIPLQSTNILDDIKMAANFYTASLYKGRREQPEDAKFWKEQFTETINGIIEKLSIDGNNYVVERFNSRFGRGDVFALWD